MRHLSLLIFSTKVFNKLFETIPVRRIMSSTGQLVDQTTASDAREIFHQAVNAVMPSQMIQNSLHFDPDKCTLQVSDRKYLVNNNVYVVGFGKAVLGMARALEDCLSTHIVHGVISVPHNIVNTLSRYGKQDMLLKTDTKIRVIEGAKDNLPDLASQAAAEEISSLAQGLDPEALLVVLISGGGSALLPSPIAPVTLDEMLQVTQKMSRAGANIVQLNSVRKELESLKGGGLAQAAHPAQVLSLILSDVIGDPLDFIASGPTVPNTTTPVQCLQLFEKFNIQDDIPESVKTLLTKKSKVNSQVTTDWSSVHNVLVGTNIIACEKAKEMSEALGYSSFVFSTSVDGNVRNNSQMFAALAKYISLITDYDVSLSNMEQYKNDILTLEEFLRTQNALTERKLKDIQQIASQAREEKKGVCVIAGGETIVEVNGKGVGGRNQEMAVWAALDMFKLFHSEQQSTKSLPSPFDRISLKYTTTKLPSVVFLSAGTDGQDGPTPAAGALVDPSFCEKVLTAGLDISQFLDNNDTHTLLTQIEEGGNLVETGLTGTNVMDIQILMVGNTL